MLSARPCEAAPAAARVAQPVMGTVLEVTVIAAEESVARRLAIESFAIARRWDDVLSTWRDDAELARLNAQAGSGLVPISVSLHAALARMRSLHDATGEAFDPAVGASVIAFRERADASKPPRPPRSLRYALRLEPGAAALAAGVALDAGGVGKGVALDAIAAHLASAGALAWFLDFGGSSQLAHGRLDGSSSWKLAVSGVDPGRVHGIIHLDKGSLSTSRALAAGDAAGSIVDPRSGTPVTPPRLATVWAPDATTADAWSTALVVLGRDGVERARVEGLEVLYEDANGLIVTPGLVLAAPPPP